MKTKTQTEIVCGFIKKHGSITPSHFSVNIDGKTISYESFCRRLRDLDNVEKTKNSKGHVTYHWKGEKDEKKLDVISYEPTKKELNFIQLELC